MSCACVSLCARMRTSQYLIGGWLAQRRPLLVRYAIVLYGRMLGADRGRERERYAHVK